MICVKKYKSLSPRGFQQENESLSRTDKNNVKSVTNCLAFRPCGLKVIGLDQGEKGYQVFRNVCPRNCYDTCGMLSYVRNGILVKVNGDPQHGYTRGKLCAKGYTYVKRVYDPERIKYPMRQVPRGSGIWKRITWEEALTAIAEKILDLKAKHGSYLPVCLNKYSGNFGMLHYAVERMFSGLGPTTRVIGSPCWSAGLDAQTYDFGAYRSSDPKDLAHSRFLILWGINPAWTAVHSMPYINQAKQAGARIVVIDPYFSATARKADEYIQIKPGTDGALALAMARVILDEQLYDQDFIQKHVAGWEQFKHYLLKEVTLGWASSLTGIDAGVIEQLARRYATSRPANIWAGFGLQRHCNGGQTIRSIDALAALTGNIGLPGGGVQFAHTDTWKFRWMEDESWGTIARKNRTININDFARQVRNMKEDPVKMLWVSCRNPLSQDPDTKRVEAAFEAMELVVTVDHFLTRTARRSDIVLPATTHFEEWDVVPSYWHHWIAINEPAIRPYFEAKSDLHIALALSAKLNQLAPGSCRFPVSGSEEEFLDREFTPELYGLLGIGHWTELRQGPRRVNLPVTAWADRKFATPSGKYELYSRRAQEQGLPPLPIFVPGARPGSRYPYWLLTTHQQHGLNSQFQNLGWMLKSNPEPVVMVNPDVAGKKNLQDGDLVKVYNEQGWILAKASVTANVPEDVLVCHQAWFPGSQFCVNYLTQPSPTDMGSLATGSSGNAFYDTFVDVRKV